jgi:glycosyltransferase involved in cell wall biosynthesis
MSPEPATSSPVTSAAPSAGSAPGVQRLAEADVPELTIVMPCLNEEETLAVCIKKARAGLAAAGVRGEILIADNGSKDKSVQIAEAGGARVVHVKEKGYGSALRGGIEAARAPWIIMGDADDSYDFSRIEGFVQKFREGYELVMGCRLPIGGGTVSPGAMPWKNRWIGNPTLSFIGRLFFHSPAQDFHCGLRGFTKAAYQKMELKTTGMEFASEMVISSTLKSLRIAEVPITLHKDGRSRPPHLKPWRDGWRHLRFMLIFSPRWLFLMPGLLLAFVGAIASAILAVGPLHVGKVSLDSGTLAISCMVVIIGIQLVAFAFFTKVFAIGEGLLPQDQKFSRLFKYFSLERGIVFGLAVLLFGFGWLCYAFWVWGQAGYGPLPYGENMRRLIPAVTLIVAGIQTVFSSFFMSVLGLKTSTRRPPAVSQ